MKNQKESIVVFEDWFRYARCLNDTEFRTFMNTILQYYKEPFTPDFTGLMLEVWNDIIDDLDKNIQSRQNRRDAVEKNRQKNSKVNKSLTPKSIPTNGPTGRPTISPTIEPTSIPDTSGMVMVDGRLETEYVGWKIVDRKTGYDDRGNYGIKDTLSYVDEDGFPIPPISQSKLELEQKKLAKFEAEWGDD
jgi:hypothetical protein